MKILMRREGEKVVIDDYVTITVKSIRFNQVVLGIEDQRHDPPYREEVIDMTPDQEVEASVMSRR